MVRYEWVRILLHQPCSAVLDLIYLFYMYIFKNIQRNNPIWVHDTMVIDN